MMRKKLEFGTATVVSERRIDFGESIELARQARQVRKHKYNASRTTVDGITFDSKKESEQYRVLKLRESLGEITNLRLQVRYELRVNGLLITTYKSDFTFVENGKEVVMDAKGYKTRAYKIAKKLMLAIHGIEINEVF